MGSIRRTRSSGPVAEQHDVLIIGAGLSGINTAHHFRQKMPHREFTVLEARSEVGGTWSFFKYPGFRSDSYMSTFGLQWYPWPHEEKIGSGAAIKQYLNDAVDADGLRDRIRLSEKVLGYEWKSEEQQWTLDVDADGAKKVYKANFVLCCTGYYSYDRAMDSHIPGIDNFGGQVVHPQWWPEDLDYSNKRIALIGSGATAITLVPNLVKTAAHLTMIQRSPSYYANQPSKGRSDPIIARILPAVWASWFIWWKDLIFEMFVSRFALNCPSVMRSLLIKMTKKEIPKDLDIDVHFNPRYNPFEQRLCLCPDGDFFQALHRDNCELVTDTIETVTKDGIMLKSGKKVEADIIITATGLYFQVLSGLKPIVDGKAIDAGSHWVWRGCMLDSLPNMAFIIGYVTQAWTPGADMMARVSIRVMKTMEAKKATSVVPVKGTPPGKDATIAVNANSNYFVKAKDRIPKVTNEGPWYGRVHLLKDAWAWLFGSMEDGLVYRTS